MKNLRFILLIVGVLMIFNACNLDDIYKQELYKHVIALVSSDNYNILEYTHELGVEEPGYIVASCGGTESVSNDIRITLKEDHGVLDSYNWNMYELDSAKYGCLLPSSNYVMDNSQIIIPQGKYSGSMSIRFKPDGLSPDSAYFLPLSIESTSDYELHPKKSNILYRVLIKNQYAEQLVTGYTYYRMDGYAGNTFTTIMSRPVQPLTANTVRMYAGTLINNSPLPSLEDGAIVLEISGNDVRIRPYKEGGSLIITQINIDDVGGNVNYPNTYQIVTEWDRKYKEFRLHYKYKMGSAAEIEMREQLRLEVLE
jgi:hypothetical protein